MSKNDPNHDLQKQIDENLKRVYADQLEEQLPERFTTLLAQLRARDGKPTGTDA